MPNPNAGVVIPETILTRHLGGVVIDSAYKPKRTPLIDLAERVPGWKAVSGIMMLIEQGIGQCTLWTNRVPPKSIISSTVLESYDADQAK